MEAVGLAVGIVSLYKATIDVLDRIETYKSYEAESQITIARYNASKLRLRKWAEAFGIAGGRLPEPHDSRLDDIQSAAVITNILRCITTLFDKVEYKSASLKLPLKQRTADADDWITSPDPSRSKFEHRQPSSIKSRIAWGPGGYTKLSKDVNNLETLINILYNVVTPHLSDAEISVNSTQLAKKLDLLSDIHAGFDTLLQTATTLRQDSAESWLDAPKDDDLLSNHIGSRLDGTCEWIERNPVFNDWMSNDSPDSSAKFLWICGPAGFGKTIMSAYLILHLKEQRRVSLAYCFSSSLASRALQLVDVVRVWIAQIIRIDSRILDLTHQMHQIENTRRASSDDIWKLLRQISTQAPGSLVFVLDGLDEFTNAEDSRQHFLAHLKDAVAGSSVRILITSRVEADIESELSPASKYAPHYTNFECRLSEEHVLQDIGLFAQHVVAKKLPQLDERFRQELAAEIMNKCEGMFLWIKLQQDGLRGTKSKNALRAFVQAMPQGLSRVYERNWEDIQALNELDRNRAIAILRWLTYSFSSLTVQELAEALTFDSEGRIKPDVTDEMPSQIDDDYMNGEIKGLCGSLVEIRDGDPGDEEDNTEDDDDEDYHDKDERDEDERDEDHDSRDNKEEDEDQDGHEGREYSRRMAIVHPTHVSAREFVARKLVTLPHDCFSWGPTPESAQDLRLAAACIRFLDCSTAWSWFQSRSSPNGKFMNYACRNWWRHIKATESSCDVIDKLVNDFMSIGNQNFEKWERFHRTKLWKPHGRSIQRASSFYYACTFGLHNAMNHLYTKGNGAINTAGGFYGTPLQAVCVTGDMAAFKRLIQWGADVGMTGGHFDCALNAAAYRGRIDMLKMIFDSQIITTIPSNQKESAIESTATRGYHDVVNQIINNEEKTKTAFDEQQSQSTVLLPFSLTTALRNAARNGHSEIVETLADFVTDLDPQDSRAWSAFHLAAMNNHVKVVEMLLRLRANIKSTGLRGSPLALATFYATFFGHTETLELLLQYGSEMNSQDLIGRTPLHFAASIGHHNIVRILLNKGASTVADKEGYLPLHCAASSGSLVVAQLLLDHGADVNVQDKDGWTPLSLAARNGHQDIVRMLLDEGAAFIADYKGWLPLHCAAFSGSPAVAKLLLDHGADVNDQDKDAWTPLHIVNILGGGVRDGNKLEVAKLLLDYGAQPSTDENGCTPLHIAAALGLMDIVALFLSRGHAIDAQDAQGSTPLFEAIEGNQTEVAELLLGRNADCKISNKLGWTPLSLAVMRANLHLIEKLVERDCNINATTRDGRTALIRAVAATSGETIELLIKSGADLLMTDRYGMNALKWLERLRPHLRVALHPDWTSSEAHKGPENTILSGTVRSIATSLRRGERDGRLNFYNLAYCFLLFKMEDDARLSYQLNIRTEDNAECDGCETSLRELDHNDTLFVCKTCPKLDICRKCMKRHTKKSLREVCQNHEFMEVVPSEAPFKSQTEAYEQWLDSILERFKEH